MDIIQFKIQHNIQKMKIENYIQHFLFEQRVACIQFQFTELYSVQFKWDICRLSCFLITS